jgi:hypothetical protein
VRRLSRRRAILVLAPVQTNNAFAWCERYDCDQFLTTKPSSFRVLRRRSCGDVRSHREFGLEEP